jgi:hypothetical protein
MRSLLPLLLLCAIPVFGADNILPGGSFETPVVKGRTAVDQGGDPSNGGRGPNWIIFKFTAGTSGSNGSITGGLTDEIAHDGKQSLFIDFNHVKTPYQSATLISGFIPVVSGSDYQVAVWGRTDPIDLITADDRPAYLKLEVDFFAADANESVGDPFYSVLPIPGSKDHDPFFKPDSWKVFFAKTTAPAGAVFAQLTWRWESAGSDPGEINGIMYFDDMTMMGAPNPVRNLAPVAIQEPSPTADDASPSPSASPSPATDEASPSPSASP